MTYIGLFRTWATVLVAMLAAILLTTAAFATGTPKDMPAVLKR